MVKLISKSNKKKHIKTVFFLLRMIFFENCDLGIVYVEVIVLAELICEGEHDLFPLSSGF